MAKYSESRGGQFEVKYLHKVWSRVDNGIELPDSLTGQALLPKLDNLEHPVPLTRKIRFGPHIFTWQSGVTYAAAFLLIVALSAVIRRGDSPSPEMLEGSFSMIEETQVSAEDAAAFSTQRTITPFEGEEAEASMGSGESTNASAASESAMSSSAAVDYTADEATTPSYEGIGGQSESILLGQEGIYTYTYRANDATDPDKVGYPITVNIMDTASGELTYSVDIPDMLSVEEYWIYEDKMAVMGFADKGMILRLYDSSMSKEPIELFVHKQEGTLLGARLYKNIIHTVVLAEDMAKVECETVQLTNSTANTSCVITAINLDNMEVYQKSFAGAGEDAALYNLNVYLNYNGEVTEDNQTGRYGAHIRLDGMEIELGSNS